MHIQSFSKKIRQNAQILVFARLLDDCPNVQVLMRALDGTILSKRLINPDPFEFRGIRQYEPTDSLKSVNFKATAKTGQLMVNIFAPTDSPKITFVLNLATIDHTVPPELYEQSIRLCATLARHYIHLGMEVALLTNGRDSITGETMRLSAGTADRHLYSLYECLARIALSYYYAPMGEQIAQITDRNRIYLIISPYHKADMLDALAQVTARGVSAHMVVPVFGGHVLQDRANIMVWDAEPQSVAKLGA